MVDLLIIQLRLILNDMINSNILSSNILFQMSTVLIIFVFGDCNGCKNNGNTIVGINIYTKSYIFILKTYLNSIKSISVGLIFCLISMFGDVRIKLYLSKEYYGNDITYLVTLIHDGCLEWDYISNYNIFVNNDNLDTDYGIFNPSVRFTGIQIHDNYTIQGYGNNSQELIILILRDNQAEGSNMLDLSTSGMNCNWPTN